MRIDLDLFLATFHLERYAYPNPYGTRQPERKIRLIRLIRAEGVNEAEAILRAAVERIYPYGTSCSIVDLEITRCLE